MDRFIGNMDNDKQFFFLHLKSNMDRFIAVPQVYTYSACIRFKIQYG